MARQLTIAINMTINGGTQRRIVRGVVRYSQVHAYWKFVEHEGVPLVHAPQLKHYKYHGLITSLNDAADLSAAMTSKVPVVAVTKGLSSQGIPMVVNDDAATGEMAAKYFLDKGFRRFAYYGASDYRWATERGEAFSRVIEQRGFCVSVATVPHAHNLDQASPRLIRWLAGMGKPLAVMASDDLMGRHVLAACEKAAIKVPEEVAVLSVDNDDLLCNMATPPLSSIEQDCDRIGYDAAALLDRMMGGERPAARIIQIPPLQIESRQSTEITAIEDVQVAEVLQLIRSKAAQPFGVKEILGSVPMSRRTLERRFIAALGRNPGEEIRRVRLERAMQLLRQSDLKVDQVAVKSGFGDARGLASAFRHQLKTSPSAYRRQFKDR